MVSGTQVRWKQLLAKAKDLQIKSGTAVYDRVKVLVSVAKDTEFADTHDESQCKSILDAHLNDTCLDFYWAAAMLEQFPTKEEWTTQGLSKLLLRTKEAKLVRQREPREEDVPRVSNRPTKVQFERLEKEANSLSDRVEHQQTEMERAQRRIAELENENSDLRRENARLEGRIAELERIASRQLVGA